ncbi:MAG: protein-export chaperone SecB [Alphaproteobacteria bacterium]|nr:protein-export chaperone SecB [Alphaproteobacteria bacterium]
MSDTPAPGPQNGEGAPSLRVLAQYLKDLSFENPRAPLVYGRLQGAPSMAVNVDVNARAIGDNQYEVELSVSAKATHEDETVFVAETAYAGAFEIVNVPQEQLEIVLLVECPRILFPFIRQVLADVTQSGNFPPVMLDPIDFLSIYEQRRRQAASAQKGEGALA